MASSTVTSVVSAPTRNHSTMPIFMVSGLFHLRITKPYVWLEELCKLRIRESHLRLVSQTNTKSHLWQVMLTPKHENWLIMVIESSHLRIKIPNLFCKVRDWCQLRLIVQGLFYWVSKSYYLITTTDSLNSWPVQPLWIEIHADSKWQYSCHLWPAN